MTANKFIGDGIDTRNAESWTPQNIHVEVP